MAESSEALIKPKRFRRGLALGPTHPVAVRQIEDMPPPGTVYVPLKQHMGPRCEPKVVTGDRVLMGQILGESADPSTAPIHAPVSGKVTAVGDHDDPFGRRVLTVTIENDGLDEWGETHEPDSDFMAKKVSAMMAAVRRSGLVDARSGKPVISLMAPPERPQSYIFLVGIPVFKPIKILIVNALDPEPTMVANRRMVLDRSDDLRAGMELVKKLSGAQQLVLAVGEDLGAGSNAVLSAAGDIARPLVCENRYPLAVPELLTTAVTGREVPWPNGEPRDVGTMVLDAESVVDILDAVRSNRPKVDRVVSVTGREITPRNIRVRLGTPVGDILNFVGAAFDRSAKVIMGGLMDGPAQYSPTAPVTKQTSAVTVLGYGDLVKFDEHICIKCGRCVEVCPVRILPNVITNLCEFGYFAEAEDAELFKCIECGCCACVCPAKRPLVQYVKHGKAEVTAMRAAQ
jgi:electron transport complex protein RnfC